MKSRKVILLRGVTPNGHSKIPSMLYLAQILEEAGFSKVKTYRQNGNIVLETNLSDDEIREKVHSLIYNEFGADISVIIKDMSVLKMTLEENPFKEGYDPKRVKLMFTNDKIDRALLSRLLEEQFDDGSFLLGKNCLYLYAPKCDKKRKFTNVFFERKLRITATSRNVKIIGRICQM